MTCKPFFYLAVVLLIKAAAILWFVNEGNIGLGPDEAQYWTWSQMLDWGYYSKPPGIAWQIRLGTSAFGNTELGVRAGAIAIGTLLPLAVYALAAACRLKSSTCTLAAIVFALSPLGWASSFLAITDGAMVLFWALATATFCRMVNQVPSGMQWNYLLVGSCVLGGALFKWPMYLFWNFVVAWALVYREYFNRQLIYGMSLSMLGILPSVIWNHQQGWPTFRHVFSTIHNPEVDIGTSDLIRGNFWEFLTAQAILLSPLIFVLLLLSFWALLKAWKQISPGIRFCGASTMIILLCYSAVSIFKKMQGNWCDFAFPGASVLLCWYACEYSPHKQKWVYAGIGLSLLMSAALISIPTFQANEIAACCQIPFKSNPFKHNLGWRQLEDILEQLGYDPNTDFLFSDRYQMSSILSFYGPKQKRAYFLNLHGIRKNQFSYWSGMDSDQVGRKGYFVVVENAPHLFKNDDQKKYSRLLDPYFAEVKYEGEHPLFYSYGQVAKAAYIFKCSGYNGKTPPESMLY